MGAIPLLIIDHRHLKQKCHHHQYRHYRIDEILSLDHHRQTFMIQK